MARMNVKGTIFNTNNNITDDGGYAIPPIASNLGIGQFAVNTSETDPCIFFKTSAGKIVKIVSEEKLTKALTDILGNSAAELDTLRELIAQFEGSANDIIPLLTDLKRRVESAESTLGTKADKSALNSHTSNTNNPHNVTKTQVGLSNVLNKEQLGKNENAVSATSAKYQSVITIEDFVGKKVSEAKNQIRTIISQNVDKGSFILNLKSFGSDLVNNWANDNHVLGTGNTYVYAEVTCATAGLYAFLKITTYASRAFYTTYITSSGWGTMSRVMHFGDTAANSNQLGGIPSGHFWHQGNSNLSTVNWTAKKLTAKSGLFEDASASPLFIHRTDSDVNVGLVFQGSTISKSLGTANGELRFGDTADLSGSGKTVWHAGNSNKSTVDWNARGITANGNIVNNLHNYYIKTATSWSGWGRGLYWQSEKGSILASVSAGGATGDTITGMTFDVSGAERMRITNNGRVGFGTTNPDTNLHVYQDAGSLAIKVANKTGRLLVSVDSNGVGGLWMQTNNSLKFGINNAEVARFSATTGYLGLGVDNPTQRLDVRGNVKVTGELVSFGGSHIIHTYTSWQGWARGIVFKKQDNTAELASINAGGSNGSNADNITMKIMSVRKFELNNSGIKVYGNGFFDGNVTAKGDIIAMKTDVTVFTASDAAGGATRLNDLLDIKLPEELAAKMVLAYDPAQINSDGTKGGYTFMPSAGTGTGTVSATEIASLPEHNHNDIVYPSDERLKENITTLSSSMKVINSLNPKSFSWNEKAKSFGLNDKTNYGFIAQDVQKIVPELVKPLGREDYIAVDYVQFIPIIVSGMQEQHSELIEINNRMKSIRLSVNKAYSKEIENAKKIEYLENKVLELETLLSKR